MLDMKLPGMGGAEVLKIINSRWPQTAVVCITAFGTIPDAVASIQTGALDYLQKPFDNMQFLIVANRAIEAKKARQDAIGRVDRLESEYGTPYIAGRGGPIQMDLEPVSEVLQKLASFLTS